MSDIQLTTKQASKVERAIKALNDVRREVEKANQGCDINWYLEDTANLHLMSGLSHDDQHKARHDAVIASFTLDEASGGGW